MKYSASDTRNLILADFHTEAKKPGATAATNVADLARDIGRPYDHVRYVLALMVEAGEVVKHDTIYEYTRPEAPKEKP